MTIERKISKNPVVAYNDMTAVDALRLMRRENIAKVPVLDRKGNLVGVITEKDILKASLADEKNMSLLEMAYEVSNLTIDKLMTKEVITIGPNTSVEKAARLFSEGYDMVIGTDVDEFLVVDPAVGQDLICFLSTVSAGGVSISGLGVDVGQNTACEGPLAEKLPFLSQRRYALLSTRYSKSSVLTSPVEWGSGFHRTRKHNFHIVRNLYLFHFGCVDLARIEAKFSDSERVAEGWSRHFRKSILYVF